MSRTNCQEVVPGDPSVGPESTPRSYSYSIFPGKIHPVGLLLMVFFSTAHGVLLLHPSDLKVESPTGWWLTYPSEKYESVRMTFHAI